jgi:hypothetical protein
MLTVEMVQESVPKNLKGSVTQSFVDKLNKIDEDVNMAETMQENFVTCSSVLTEGKFKMEDYLNAVKFVSLLMAGLSKRDAWVRTFPDRHQELVAKGKSDQKTISSHVAMYASGQLVNKVTQQSLIPFHIINQDARQKALNKQVRLMMTAKSELVQMQAANSVLVHTTPPKEVVAAQVNVNVGTVSALKNLEGMLNQLAQRQHSAIESGTSTTRAIAASSMVVDAETEPA